MPVIARFEGIILRMYLRQKEHNPPHIHAIYGERVGLFMIETTEMFEGDIPLKCQQKMKRFIEHYREELYEMWNSQVFRVLEPVDRREL
ncbi:MAG: DUF4160 domain-containing protein [Eubacterium sp.]|jgi:hypothetical protein|nr:DUF4160 domain-containing protein [Eubacterium sp.]